MRSLRDTWVVHGSQVKAEGDAAEITRLLKDELESLRASDGGWRQLLRRYSDGAFWELPFPQSEMHGGTARVLTELDIAGAGDWA